MLQGLELELAKCDGREQSSFLGRVNQIVADKHC